MSIYIYAASLAHWDVHVYLSTIIQILALLAFFFNLAYSIDNGSMIQNYMDAKLGSI